MSPVAGLRERLALVRAGRGLVPRAKKPRVLKPVPGPEPGAAPQKSPFVILAGITLARDELLRGRPFGRLLHLARWTAAAMSMLFGSKFHSARLARRVHVQIRRGRGGLDMAAATAERLAASAPSPAHRAIAADLQKAVGSADLERAARIALHLELLPDFSEQIVSRKHRFLWIRNPKVASNSICNALCRADPDVEVFRNCNTDDVLTLRPEARGYFSFAFVRDPFRRAVSLYGHQFLREPPPAAGLARRFHGLSADMDFEAFCAWLAGPYGADAFANRHWLSQHIQIATAAGRLPDFVGRHETIEDDLRKVARRVGLPDLRLPLINTAAGWEPSRQEAEAAHRAAETLLTDRARELLRSRYADDFRIFGYDPERPPFRS